MALLKSIRSIDRFDRFDRFDIQIHASRSKSIIRIDLERFRSMDLDRFRSIQVELEPCEPIWTKSPLSDPDRSESIRTDPNRSESMIRIDLGRFGSNWIDSDLNRYAVGRDGRKFSGRKIFGRNFFGRNFFGRKSFNQNFFAENFSTSMSTLTSKSSKSLQAVVLHQI